MSIVKLYSEQSLLAADKHHNPKCETIGVSRSAFRVKP
jgi:hypothetical protein